MREHLQVWYARWLEDNHGTDLVHTPKNPRGEPSLAQVHFVRDHLSALLWADQLGDRQVQASQREGGNTTAFVIGEHTAKSVRLPVYSLERPDRGIRLVLRNNFHDWNVSMLSEQPIAADLRGFEVDARGCYFEGFPADLQFGSHSENPCKFSLRIHSEYDVYTFLWLIVREVRVRSGATHR